MYDHPGRVPFTQLQRIFLAYVSIERDKLEIYKTKALCLSSLASASLESSTTLVNRATESIEEYIKLAARAEHAKEEQDEQLKRQLSELSNKAFIIRPPSTSYK